MSKKDEALKLALEALEGIYRYGLDTLSGRRDGPDDRDWQRAGVNAMTKRAGLSITAIREALAEQPAPVQQEWATVPVEPTVAMIDATGAVEADMREMVVANWQEMLAAAPQPAQQEPVAWLVCSINSDDSLSLEYAAAWEEGAHEHINDAITEHGFSDAAKWVVRPAYTSPAQQGVTIDSIYKATKEAAMAADRHQKWLRRSLDEAVTKEKT